MRRFAGSARSGRSPLSWLSTVPVRRVPPSTGPIEALARASAAVDRIAAELQGGQIPLVGRTEAELTDAVGANACQQLIVLRPRHHLAQSLQLGEPTAGIGGLHPAGGPESDPIRGAASQAATGE